jgi:hypothetical protein
VELPRKRQVTDADEDDARVGVDGPERVAVQDRVQDWRRGEDGTASVLSAIAANPDVLPPLRNPPVLEGTEDLTNLSYLKVGVDGPERVAVQDRVQDWRRGEDGTASVTCLLRGNSRRRQSVHFPLGSLRSLCRSGVRLSPQGRTRTALVTFFFPGLLGSSTVAK